MSAEEGVMNGNGRADWAGAAQRVAGFLAGCRDYQQSAELAADLAALRAYGLDRNRDWRSRFVSAEQALTTMRRQEAEIAAAAEAERAGQVAAFAAAYRPEPLLKRHTGTGINAGHHFGRSNPAERERREVNRIAWAADNRAMAEGFGCGKKAGGSGNGKRRSA